MNKNILVQASKRREKSTANPKKTTSKKCIPITITSHTIKPIKSHKFFGVIIDKELHFKEQLASAVAKGISYSQDAICIDVWGAKMIANLGRNAGRKGLEKVLERVLQTHAITSSGAMRTTVMDAAVAHTNLTLIPFTLQKSKTPKELKKFKSSWTGQDTKEVLESLQY
ncbi:hypothetical protein V8B97DRAFT_1915049 [Scleroderma yunnanense]